MCLAIYLYYQKTTNKRIYREKVGNNYSKYKIMYNVFLNAFKSTIQVIFLNIQEKLLRILFHKVRPALVIEKCFS